MSTYVVTGDGRTDLPDRDAYAVTVRVARDGTDLGLWQTWISGMSDAEVDRHSRPRITKLQRRRIAAELLAEGLEAEAHAGRLRDEWQLEVTVLDPTSAGAIVGYATRASRPVPDFSESETIRSFEVHASCT